MSSMSFLRPQDAAAQPLERTSRWLTAVMAVAAADMAAGNLVCASGG